MSTGLNYSVYSGYFADNVSFFSTASLSSLSPNTGIVQQIPTLTVGTNSCLTQTTGTASTTNVSVQWTGYFYPTTSGTWTFSINSDDASYLWLGSTATSGYTTSNALVSNGGIHGEKTVTATISLTAYTSYAIRIMFGQSSGGQVMVLTITNPSAVSNSGSGYFFTTAQYPCFKENTKIMTIQGYTRVQHLRRGDLVKTLLHEYRPVYAVGKRSLLHSADPDRKKDQLYVCTPEKYPEVFEDLVLTGCHSILVDQFADESQKQRVAEVNGDIYVTDRKYRLPACADDRTAVYETPGEYTIYHVALENDNYYENYGIYANGLLVESCSKRYLKELSNMELL